MNHLHLACLACFVLGVVVGLPTGAVAREIYLTWLDRSRVRRLQEEVPHSIIKPRLV